MMETVVLKEDIVIPAGTELFSGVNYTHYVGEWHEVRVAFGDDSTGHLRIPPEAMEDKPDLFEVKESSA